LQVKLELFSIKIVNYYLINNNTMNINNLLSLLKSKNLSQEKLAAKIGMSRTGLNDLIKRNDLKVSVLEKIAEALNVSVGYFFDETDSNNGIIQNGKHNYHASTNGSINIGELECNRKLELSENKVKALEEQLKLKDEIITLLKKTK